MIWEPVLSQERERITIYISGNDPVPGQDPCDIFSTYELNDISLMIISVGTLLSFACNSHISVLADSYESAVYEILPIYEEENDECHINYETAFTGLYYRLNDTDPAIYNSSDGSQIFWTNTWNFYHEDKGMMNPVNELSFNYVPPDNETWLYYDQDGNYVLHENLPIECREAKPPSQPPSASPSLSPTECPERVLELQKTVDELEDDLDQCLVERSLSCMDDDVYISEATNGLMPSCGSFVAWLASVGLDCNGMYSIGDISSICCNSCTTIPNLGNGCIDDDAFILLSSSGHFLTCDAFVDWLYFVDQDCSYRIPGQGQTLVSHVCCSTCLSRQMVNPDPLFSPTSQPSAYCEDLSTQQDILEDYLNALETEIESILNATDSCEASIAECESEFILMEAQCNSTHAALQKEIANVG